MNGHDSVWGFGSGWSYVTAPMMAVSARATTPTPITAITVVRPGLIVLHPHALHVGDRNVVARFPDRRVERVVVHGRFCLRIEVHHPPITERDAVDVPLHGATRRGREDLRRRSGFGGVAADVEGEQGETERRDRAAGAVRAWRLR